jgi:hypothetical protein
MSDECTKLADRFVELKKRGLVDVKFFLRKTEEVTKDVVCAEVNALLDAFDNGERTRLHFGDSRQA